VALPREAVPLNGFEPWLAGLAASTSLSAKNRVVLTLLLREPRTCAFGSIRDLADRAGVNIATVTRTAQALGFDGWADLQREYRARYVASLSVTEVASEHDRLEPTAAAAFVHDRADLATVAGTVGADLVRDVARRIASARRTLVVAQGSYAAVGLALAHNAQIAGYDVRTAAEPTAIANGIAQAGRSDLVVAVNCWQIYRSTVRALAEARALGIATVLVTDLTRSGDEIHADVQLAVPSESVGFFPSLVGALSVAQAVVVELAAVDPDRTHAALAAAGRQWDAFDLLRPG
jgi:DNA-binding MurR/RpiR family transcriptional regulator